jgi:SAM-dependent methyltransferase
VDHLSARIDKPRRILDFGCGIGRTVAYLAEVFPAAVVVGADTSANALKYAVNRYSSEQMSFCHIDELQKCDPFELCYVNGVFHHIRPAERPAALSLIHECLAPAGNLALFENNPWNPGARMVMARIEFDRDAVMISPSELRALMLSAGFESMSTRSLFYFPRLLHVLRSIEPALARLPLGAQYYVLARKSR